MAKFCNNGHQMDDSWTECPYCVRTGYRIASTPDAGKTRPDMSETRPDEKPVFDGAQTVLLSAVKRAPVVGWLVVIQGPQKGEDFRLREGKNTLGKSPDCEVCLQDQTVSGKHASISYKEGKFFLTDLDSTNGTCVNETSEAVSRVELNDGDVIYVGETALKFKCL